MEIILRAEAKSKGIKKYFTGKECKNGHIAKRYTSNGECEVCKKENLKKFREDNKEKYNNYTRKYRKEKHEEFLKWSREYRSRNREKIREICKKSYYKNIEKQRERSKKYYHKNKEQINIKYADYRAEYRRKNADKIKEYKQKNRDYILKQKSEYREKNKHKIRQYRIDNIDKINSYKKQNIEKYREHCRNYQKKFRKTEKGKLTYFIRSSLRRILDKIKQDKNISLSNSLPYTLDELKYHIENKFVKGMTWKNYGKIWHIDHIIPVSYYAKNIDKRLSQVEIFSIVNSLDNLQPLFAKDNIKKGNKLQIKEVGNEWV